MSRRVSNWHNITTGAMMNRTRMYRNMKERPIYVVLPCNGDKMDERDVNIDNIEEDIQGRDLVSFTCPACGERHKSFRIS